MNKENYWSQRYVDEKTGWDLGMVSTPIKEYVDQLKDKTLKILIPGAGNAYEAEYMFREGFKNLYIIDISPLPLENFKKRVPDFPSAQILQGDFFELNDTFDIIIEQTFFCSFPPIDNNREKYVAKMHDLLSENGKLVGVWFNFPFTGDLTKRPFGSTQKEYEALFSSHFTLDVFEESYNSVPDRRGQELFGILKKRKR
ncbi:methyltransferase domain-containing protein [Aureisphaera galaxeae]|nr:methyltransferase domain-containing protein [Aureisphaera galaxeae]MDC8004796.1 methyltransferase domain-containing protein [Aureisphaera galaxeae]